MTTSGREALEVELGIKPLHIRRQELSIREGSKIISKSDQILIKKSWLNWKDEIENEKFLSPFGKIQLQLEDMTSETGTITFNIEPEFSFEDSLQPSKRRPEYWDRLGSSKSRTNNKMNPVQSSKACLITALPAPSLLLQTVPVNLTLDLVGPAPVSSCHTKIIQSA